MTVSAMTQTDESKIELLFDMATMRPACVVLQAVYGCPTDPVQWFDKTLWETRLTDSMRKLRGTRTEFRTYADQLNAKVCQ